MENSETYPKNWLRQFVIAWIGQAFSLLGSQVVQFALIWWLTMETGKATTLALAALMGLLPQVLIGPIAGTLVDRSNRKLIMVLADGLVALVTVGLVLAFWSGQVQIWHVYLAMFLRSAAGGFQFPAWQASTSLMAPKQHLSRIQGFNQMLNGLMNIGAPVLGALLISFLPMAQVLAVDILTAGLAIGLILVVRIPQPKGIDLAVGIEKPSVWADLRAGLSFIFSWTGLVLITATAMIINLILAPASSLIPILVTKYFGGQAYELAWMESALGAGMIAGGLLLGIWGGFKRRIYTTLVGLIVLAISSIAIGLTPSNGYWVAVMMMLVTGIAAPIIDGPLMAVAQATVPPEMQGRAFMLIGGLSVLMTPLGLAIAGPLADAYGVQMWFVIGGVITGLLGLSGFFVPAIVYFEEGKDAVRKSMEQAPLRMLENFRRRFPFNFSSAILAALAYCTFTMMAFTRYPLRFSPITNWLSDLGNPIANPQGAIFYKIGVILAASLLAIWFVGLFQWRLTGNTTHKRFLLISQIAGILAAFALLMSAIYPIHLFEAHSFWSRTFFMLSAIGFGFSVASLRYHPKFTKEILVWGTCTAVMPTLMLIFGEAYWLEWMAVGCMLIYMFTLGKESLPAIARKSPGVGKFQPWSKEVHV